MVPDETTNADTCHLGIPCVDSHEPQNSCSFDEPESMI